MKAIDANTTITAILFDEEHEDRFNERMTVETFLDRCTEEGCPWECIVRCKECKYYKFDWCNLHDSTFNSDDFCNYGERREND